MQDFRLTGSRRKDSTSKNGLSSARMFSSALYFRSGMSGRATTPVRALTPLFKDAPMVRHHDRGNVHRPAKKSANSCLPYTILETPLYTSNLEPSFLRSKVTPRGPPPPSTIILPLLRSRDVAVVAPNKTAMAYLPSQINVACSCVGY